MKKVLGGMFALLLTFLLAVPIIQAATISVSQAGADPDSVMKGKPFTIQVSGLSGSGEVSLINLPAGFSAEGSPPYPKSFSSGTSSVSWTTATISQSHDSTTITASIEVAGSPSTVESAPFAVKLSPSIDIISFTPTGPLSDPTGTQTVNLNFRNTGETDARNVVVAVTLPSGASLSSGSATETISEIDGKPDMPSVGRSWIVNFGSGLSSSGTITITITPSNADSKTRTISISVTPPGEEGPPGGGLPEAPPEKAKNATRRPTLVPGVGLRNNTKLQAALERVLNIAKLSEQAIENLIRLSESITADIEIVRNFEAKDNKSTLSMNLKYRGEKKVKNFTVYDSLPKEFANSSDLITVSAPGSSYAVVEEDPEYVFVYPELSPDDTVTITYTINEEVDTSIINDTETEVYAMSLEEIIIPPGAVCTPGAKRCVGNDLQQCKSDGSAWETIETCTYGCDSVNLRCKTAEEALPAADYTWLYLAIIVIIIIIIIGVVVAKKLWVRKI